MVKLIIEWLRDNFHWSTTAENDDGLEALRDGAQQDDDAERAAVRDAIREQRGDIAGLYIPLI